MVGVWVVVLGYFICEERLEFGFECRWMRSVGMEVIRNELLGSYGNRICVSYLG